MTAQECGHTQVCPIKTLYFDIDTIYRDLFNYKMINVKDTK